MCLCVCGWLRKAIECVCVCVVGTYMCRTDVNIGVVPQELSTMLFLRKGLDFWLC